MATKLDRTLVTRWLEDQQAAAQRIEEERVHFLLNLSPEQALTLYLTLPYPKDTHRMQPSPVLLAMRRALAR
ncbi:MAG: hypothetical protein NZ610_04825 [Candidatus Bipolaricaulota bacterium]|nr:hypothetical protein [Candidatus Bipolaricaulota bacterium]MCS7274713.1 hypothetical protein [Candidatus Bipolaricaulota bacterium]MDW8109990.1 hypothetical protein [Candidatus Bipolaricaulota bacterium]MDW8328938.1 hypothetical protein [Candidatus Bipolaricaulota bacterium]